MKKKVINETHIEGYLYEHKLRKKVSGPNSKKPGTPFISGSISIATDNLCTNIIQVNFTYVTEKTNSGANNKTYLTLDSILEGRTKTYMANGKEEAALVRVDSALGVNDFYLEDGTLVSHMRNEGGFVHVMQPMELNPKEKERATFKVDMVINDIKRLEADPEKNIPERMSVKGGIFNFMGDVKPVSFVLYNPDGMNFFEGLEISPKNPYFTWVKGKQTSKVVINKIEEETAFGDVEIKEVRSSFKEWEIVNACKAEANYVQDDPESLSWQEFADKLVERETFLANKKAQDDAYRQSRKDAAKQAINGLAQDEYSF